MDFEEWWENNKDDIDCHATPKEAFEFTWNAALASRWQPIETAPRDRTRIIVCSANGNVWCDVLWEKMQRKPDRWASFIGPLPFDFTHWMPLPEPPES